MPTLKYRRHRGSVIETYKILHGIYDTAVSPVLPICQDSVTRGNTWKLVKNLSKYVLPKRIINIWDSLPLHVVNSSSVNSFKNNLDRFWVVKKWHFPVCGKVTGKPV